MTLHLAPAELHRLVRSVFVRCGLPEPEVDAAADVVCYADRHGFATHGVNQLVNNYAPGLRSGRIPAGAVAEVVGGLGGVAVVDGNAGLGLVTMTFAVDRAADLARSHGVGAVAVRNSGHFGAAGFYTHRLATQGMIGIAMTNCGAQGVVPPLGGAVRMLGTNPLSAAVPAASAAPFVLDMSTTVVATGRVKAALRDGADVPSGWLVDREDGSAVTDPAAYVADTADVRWLGGSLVTGGAKGFGLGLLVDLLCGPLAGAAFGPRREVLTGAAPARGNNTDSDIGHFVLALDTRAFGDGAEIEARSAELLETVAACPPAGYTSSVTYPGAPEAARAATADVAGVPLDKPVAAAFAELLAELDIEAPEGMRP